MRRTVTFTSLALALVLTGAVSAVPARASGVPDHDKCVVSLSPTATETLYQIGAGHEVEAVDDDSDYPTHGLPTKKINAFSPSAEAIATICAVTTSHPSHKPNLVVISYNADRIEQKLQSLGISVLYQTAPDNLAGAYRQMLRLGQLTGYEPAAQQLVDRLQSEIARDVASVPAHPHQKLTVYYELDTGYYSLTSDTFVGQLMKSLGITNIADKVGVAKAGGYPQLSAEYVLSADPRLVFLADTVCCHVDAANFAKRPGFSILRAVRFHHVVGLNDDIASRWGPRLGILVGDLAAGARSALADKRLWSN